MMASVDPLRHHLGKGVESFSTRRNSILPYPVITGHQVHGIKVAVVERPDMTRDDLEGYDALVTNLRGWPLGCVLRTVFRSSFLTRTKQ